jgi:tRNA threonylcarbamoyl adenosine modification protein YeaZ
LAIIISMSGLILETSSNRSFALLADAGRSVAFLPLNGGEELSKNLGRQIDELLQAHPSFRASFVAIGTGPGSYTGIRVGASFAKALAFGWQVPLRPFCSLQSFIPSERGPFAVIVDARMGGFYCLKGERTQSGARFDAPRLLSLQEIAEETCPLFSPHPSDIQKRIGLNRPVFDAHPDPVYLSAYCCGPSSKDQSPLDQLTLTYLSSP